MVAELTEFLLLGSVHLHAPALGQRHLTPWFGTNGSNLSTRLSAPLSLERVGCEVWSGCCWVDDGWGGERDAVGAGVAHAWSGCGAGVDGC